MGSGTWYAEPVLTSGSSRLPTTCHTGHQPHTPPPAVSILAAFLPAAFVPGDLRSLWITQSLGLRIPTVFCSSLPLLGHTGLAAARAQG
jgi:hypothetical protein